MLRYLWTNLLTFRMVIQDKTIIGGPDTMRNSKITVDNDVHDLNILIDDFVNDVTEVFKSYPRRLQEKFDFSDIEREFNGLINLFAGKVLSFLLNSVLKSKELLVELKNIGGRLGMHFVRYREITVRLSNGQTEQILSPYFCKARSKRGRKRKKPGPRSHKGEGHLGLRAFGFIGLCSGNFVSEVVKSALLCPSIEISKQVLAERGIEIDTKTIRRLCRNLGQIGLSYRGGISLDGSENDIIDGQTLVIGVDGGRLRVRKTKPGKKKTGQKRQGYTTEWKEPNLFTIYLLNKEGEVIKEFRPLHDATMNKKNGVFEILEQYLKELDLSRISRIVFCADGDPNIWSRVETLCLNLGLNTDNLYQVLDYTHAKQNLNEIISLIPKKIENKAKIEKKWKALLWSGNIVELQNSIKIILKGKNRIKGLKKWNNYFHKNEKRMQYKFFKKNGIPCGSGCVESAIRRVINLRLKSAGSFWKKKMAEYFLFLRSQLISGRWLIFLRNVVRILTEKTKNKIERDADRPTLDMRPSSF